MTEAAFLSPPLEIEPAFLDHNGHVNMAYHLVLADRALDFAFEPIKGDDYLGTRGMTTFAAEMHVRYLGEINMHDEIRGRVRWIACDAKRAHWTVELLRSPDDKVATTVEGVSLSIDLTSRRVEPFPDDVHGRLTETVRRHAPAGAGLDWIGRHVSMSRD